MLYSAFIFGMISSLHCIGMCGPIVMMLPVERNNPVKKMTQVIIYHFGRMTAYGSMGLLFGLLGKGLFIAGIQQQLSIFAGIIMILIIALPENLFARYNFSGPVFRLISKIKSALGSRFRNKSYKSLFIIGVLNGLLPCGMVYMALFGAIAMQNAGYGVIYMILFGLGTLPLMSSVSYMGSFLTVAFRNKIKKVIPYAAVTIGLLFIIRGLGLGIPYVSPSTVSLFIRQMANCK